MHTYKNVTKGPVVLFDWVKMQNYGVIHSGGTITFASFAVRAPVVQDAIKLGKLKRVVRKKK